MDRFSPGQMPLGEKIQNMLDELPDTPLSNTKREYALSKKDARWLANLVLVVSEHQGCAIGLTTEQIDAIRNTPAHTLRAMKDMEAERNKALKALGVITLALLGGIGKLIFDTVNWTRVWQGLVTAWHFFFGK